jgi:predicted GTPase
MTKTLILGRSNVGKTLFMMNFANYIGLSTFKVLIELPGGGRLAKEYTLSKATGELVSPEPHTTLALQSLIVDIPAGKGKKTIEIIDTTGLSEGLTNSKEVRFGMAQTIGAIERARVILHMVDASKAGAKESPQAPGPVDDEIYKLAGVRRVAYVLLANKMDLPEAREGLIILKERFGKAPIIPISALKCWGFKEVRAFLLRNI